MDGLKALLEKKRKEKQELVGNDKKSYKQSDLEAAKLQKLRREEEEERQAKLARRGALSVSTADAHAAPASDTPRIELSRDEVIRRLRMLGQPATLFGEDNSARYERFRKAEAEIEVVDDLLGGQQTNTLLEIQREERERLKVQRLMKKEDEKKKIEEEDRRRKEEEAEARAAGAAGLEGGGEEGGERPAAPTAQQIEDEAASAAAQAAFARAAASVRERMEEERMAPEDRIVKWIKKWCNDWEQDLAARFEQAAESAPGRQASEEYRATAKSFNYLYQQLEERAMPEDVLKGVFLVVESMKERNYMQANSILLNAIAIGNAPWPIGVTQVGIHTRAAREKISHSMNKSASAHIMTNEATRKYLHGLKRLLTAIQRLYPTDPSRSVDFDTVVSGAKGAAGGGSAKLALLEAIEAGDVVAPKPAPHFLDKNGAVKVPDKLHTILRTAPGSGAPQGQGQGQG